MSYSPTSLEQSFAKNLPAGSAVTSCPKDSPPIPTKECDLVMLTVTVTRGKDVRTISHPNSCKASGYLGGTVVVDVLSTPKKNLPGSKPADCSKIKIVVQKYATCDGSKHPLLTITPSDSGPDGECKPVATTSATQEFPVYRKLRSWENRLINGETIPIVNLIRWFWDAISDAELGHVDVVATSCGVRKAGAVVGTVSFPIRIYPIEKYSVKLSLPPLWAKTVKETHGVTKQNFGQQPSPKGPYAVDKNQEYTVSGSSSESRLMFSPKKGTSNQTTTQSQTLMGGKNPSLITETQYKSEKNGITAQTNRVSIDDDMGHLNFSKATSTEKPWERLGIKLELKRDGSDLNFKVGEFLTCVANVAEAIKKFRAKMGSAIEGEISVGLTLSGEVNIFVVELSAEWARKEIAGPRAPWEVDCKLSGKLIDAALTAKYGVTAIFTALKVEIVNIELSATLKFEGSVAAAISKKATVLDGVWTWSGATTPITGKVKATVTATATAKVFGHGVSTKIAVCAGITVKAEFIADSNHDTPVVKGDIISDDVKLTVTLENSISEEKHESHDFILVEKFDIVKGFEVGGSNGGGGGASGSW